MSRSQRGGGIVGDRLRIPQPDGDLEQLLKLHRSFTQPKVSGRFLGVLQNLPHSHPHCLVTLEVVLPEQPESVVEPLPGRPVLRSESGNFLRQLLDLLQLLALARLVVLQLLENLGGQGHC